MKTNTVIQITLYFSYYDKYMISILPHVRRWCRGECGDNIQYLPKYWPPLHQWLSKSHLGPNYLDIL